MNYESPCQHEQYNSLLLELPESKTFIHHPVDPRHLESSRSGVMGWWPWQIDIDIDHLRYLRLCGLRGAVPLNSRYMISLYIYMYTSVYFSYVFIYLYFLLIDDLLYVYKYYLIGMSSLLAVSLLMAVLSTLRVFFVRWGMERFILHPAVYHGATLGSFACRRCSPVMFVDLANRLWGGFQKWWQPQMDGV